MYLPKLSNGVRLADAGRRSARGLILGAALMVLALVAVGCGRIQHADTPQDGYTVTMTSQPATPVMGNGALIVSITDPSGKPVTDAQLTAKGNMSHAGMKPSFGQVTNSGGGQYTVAIAWTMAGDWYVDLKATLADGHVVARRLPITVNAQ